MAGDKVLGWWKGYSVILKWLEAVGRIFGGGGDEVEW